MKKIVLCLIAFIFSGCVSAKSFRVVENRLKVLEREHKAVVANLAATYEIEKLQTEINIDLAKSARFFFARNDWTYNKIFGLQAMSEQHSKDFFDLDEKVEKMGKEIKRLKRELTRRALIKK
jgi:hypothetical protein